MGDISIFITPDAEATLSAMRQRVSEIASTYGDDSEEHRKASQSLMDCLLTILRFGGRVHRDGDLSLILTSWITIGIIFHPVRVGSLPHHLLGEWTCHS